MPCRARSLKEPQTYLDKPSRDLSVVWNASNERAEPSAMECQYTRLGGLRRSLASNSVEVPRSPQTQADCRGRDAEAVGAVFRCSKNGQTFRFCNSDGLLSHIKGSIACRISVGGGGGGHAPAARR